MRYGRSPDHQGANRWGEEGTYGFRNLDECRDHRPALRDNEDGKKILVERNRIQRYTARMNRLIGDLVDVARINAGKLNVMPEQADAAKLIAEAVDMFESPASEKGITLEAEMVQQYLPVQVDYDRMLQVLANLITNAIKFTFEGGRIRVRGERAGNEVRVSISDTAFTYPSASLKLTAAGSGQRARWEKGVPSRLRFQALQIKKAIGECTISAKLPWDTMRGRVIHRGRLPEVGTSDHAPVVLTMR